MKHNLYTDQDPDRPSAICDRNGQVALACCKACGLAEAELDEQPHCAGQMWQDQCAEMWGEGWKATLAKTLAISKRSVAKWSNHYHHAQCPEDVKQKINRTYKIWIEE